METTMNTTEWTEQARSLIARAVRAPSSHNTQPWFFRIADRTLELYADRTRALPVNDPEDRELTISCGCALANLRIAAAGEGLAAQVELLPEREDPDLLARIAFSGPRDGLGEEAGLAAAIDRRHTFRRPFAAREVPVPLRGQLIAAADHEGAQLHPLLTDEERQGAISLVAEGDAAQWDDPSWRRELAAWMHPRRDGDGLSVPGLALPAARLAVRKLDMGDWVAGRDRGLAEAAPLLAVLTTEGDQTRDWLQAGQALQRLLLVACAAGLQATYLNQPVEVSPLRPRLQALAGAGIPQILLGLGYPDEEIPPSPRRPIESVIE
jgi:nitroreductase